MTQTHVTSDVFTPRPRIAGNIMAIFMRELGAYFSSPIASIVLAMFLLVSGYFFVNLLWYIQYYGIAAYEVLFNVQFTLFIMVPLLTMRLFSEEKRSGTIELLMTAPITETQIVLGKYFAALAVYVAMLLVSCLYPLILVFYSEPDPGPLVTGYLGLFLLGMAFLSVGVFTSSITRNQIVAAVICLSFLLMIMLIQAVQVFFQSEAVKAVLTYLSVMEHFEEFTRGIIDTQSIVYFISFTAIFLFLTVRTLAAWRDR